MNLPSDLLAARARIGAPYLRGAGLEIGALDAPTPVPAGTRVRHLDPREPAAYAPTKVADHQDLLILRRRADAA